MSASYTPTNNTVKQRLNTTHSITIIKPDDWHLHLRDGALLSTTVRASAKQFARAIVMPNLAPPVTTWQLAKAYKARIDAQKTDLKALMTLYMTDQTSAADIEAAYASKIVTAVKLYPAGATTNSAMGVTDISKTYKAIEVMEALGMPLLVHGEVNHQDIDIFDRESRFIDTQLVPLLKFFPKLSLVFEHITTQDAVQFVSSQDDHNIAATITPQHLMYNRNHMLVGGIKPHLYCLPVLKRNIHQQALQDIVAQGHKRFFLGTDSAPHALHDKQSACGCAGCYSAPAALELYAQIFDDLGILDNLEAFASINGPNFYKLPINTDTVTLIREDWQVPELLTYGDHQIVPLGAGQTLRYKLIP